MQALVKLNVWKEMELVNALGQQEDGRKRRRGFGDEMLNNKVLALNWPDITLHSLALEEYQSWHGVGCCAFTAVSYTSFMNAML